MYSTRLLCQNKALLPGYDVIQFMGEKCLLCLENLIAMVLSLTLDEKS